jgi:hypothetical protein
MKGKGAATKGTGFSRKFRLIIMNYSSLKTAIQSYVENEFTTTDINVFITQAEQRVYNTVQIANLRKNVTGSLTTDNQYLTLPTDWLDTFSLAVLDAVVAITAI